MFNAGFAVYDGYKAYKAGKKAGKKGWELAGSVAWASGSSFFKFGHIKKVSKILNISKKNKKNNVVYTSVENNVTNYVGITNNFGRRAAEHLRKKGINIQPLMKGLSRSDARAVEQALIEIHKLGKNGGTLLNSINSISRKNPNYAKQLKRGRALLKSIGYKG